MAPHKQNRSEALPAGTETLNLKNNDNSNFQ